MKYIKQSFFLIIFSLTTIVAMAKEDSENSLKLKMANEALDVVKSATDDIIEVLNKEKAGIQNDKLIVYKIIQKHFLPYFDQELIAQRIAGRTWLNASPSEKVQLKDAIIDWVVRFFVATVQKYENEKVHFLPVNESNVRITRDVNNNKTIINVDVTVKSKLESGAKMITVTYMLRKDFTDGRGDWQVFNIIAGPLNVTKNYKTQFAKIASSKQLKGTLELLAEQSKRFKDDAKSER